MAIQFHNLRLCFEPWKCETQFKSHWNYSAKLWNINYPDFHFKLANAKLSTVCEWCVGVRSRRSMHIRVIAARSSVFYAGQQCATIFGYKFVHFCIWFGPNRWFSDSLWAGAALWSTINGETLNYSKAMLDESKWDFYAKIKIVSYIYIRYCAPTIRAAILDKHLALFDKSNMLKISAPGDCQRIESALATVFFPLAWNIYIYIYLNCACHKRWPENAESYAGGCVCEWWYVFNNNNTYIWRSHVHKRDKFSATKSVVNGRVSARDINIINNEHAFANGKRQTQYPSEKRLHCFCFVRTLHPPVPSAFHSVSTEYLHNFSCWFRRFTSVALANTQHYITDWMAP